ncbi:MAG TPA: condensation domain-containing protein [Pseudonocardiaceae bacterium]|nr:condensation domain-containing protein [Pseudonocardiaceae bacterium]
MADAIPLSAAQQGIWIGQQLDPDSPIFNTAEYCDIHGPVDVDALVAAIQRVVGETEAVQVVIADDAQILGRTPAWSVHVDDLTGQADPLATALAWMTDDLARVADLTTGPLFGHAVFRLGPDRVLWYHRVHHIAMDGYGLGLFARRVAEVYSGDPPPCWFGSLRAVVDEDLAYQDSAQCKEDREYWVAYYQDRPAPVSLGGPPGWLPDTVVRADGDLPESTVEEVARAAKATWIDAFLGAVATYLHRATGAEQVCLGLPVMARIGSVALRVPCMALNVVPVWIKVDPSASLTELTAQVAAEIRSGRPHHRYRHERLRRDLPGGRPLFGPSVNIMPFDYGLTFAGQQATVRNLAAGLVDDLMINVYDRADGSGRHLTFDANPNRYGAGELNAHLHRFLDLLAVNS